MNQTTDFVNLETGLRERGFTGIEGIDSMSRCHKDERHYILRTDGLVFYTTYPWSHDEPPTSKDYKTMWTMEDFTFEALDEAIAIVEFPTSYGDKEVPIRQHAA